MNFLSKHLLCVTNMHKKDFRKTKKTNEEVFKSKPLLKFIKE